MKLEGEQTMTNAKRVLCILMAAVLLLALCACGGKTTSTDTPANNQPSSGGSSSSSSSNSGSSTTPKDTDKTIVNKDDGGAAAAAASGGEGIATAKTKPDTVTIGVSGWLGRFLDGAEPAPNLSACDAVYDSLFLIDQSSKEPYSFIIKEWEWVDDLTFKMTLKDGITFRNGDVATGQDLLFSCLQHVERGSINASSLGTIDPDACTVDGNTVTLKWSEPWGPGIFSRNMYLFDESWCREKGWDSYDWYENPNGSGPYKVTEYVTDDHITLELRDDYWNAANETFTVKKYILKYFADASALNMALRAGEVDITGVSAVNYESMVNDKNLNVHIMSRKLGTVLTFMFGSVNNPIFQDKAVREAFAYGVDWSAIGKIAYGAFYEPALSQLSEKSPYYVAQGTWEYNPEKAKQILADAGYKDGDLSVHYFAMTSGKDSAEAMKFYCEQMGIKCDLEFGDTTTGLMTWMKEGGSDFGFYNNINGVPNGESHETLNCFYIKGFTWCWYHDEDVRNAFLKAAKTTDDASRAAQYAELQKKAYEDIYFIPVCECVSSIGFNPDVFSDEEINAYTYTSSYLLLHQLGY